MDLGLGVRLLLNREKQHGRTKEVATEESRGM